MDWTLSHPFPRLHPLPSSPPVHKTREESNVSTPSNANTHTRTHARTHTINSRAKWLTSSLGRVDCTVELCGQLVSMLLFFKGHKTAIVSSEMALEACSTVMPLRHNARGSCCDAATLPSRGPVSPCDAATLPSLGPRVTPLHYLPSAPVWLCALSSLRSVHTSAFIRARWNQ